MFHPHPFTIAWWEGDGNSSMSSITLIVRARSGFTKKLLGRIESGCEGWAWIDGPYGPSRTSIFGCSPEVGDYGHILMVATGMGIVAQLPYIKELLDGQ
jgi:predicted ferric reductase